MKTLKINIPMIALVVLIAVFAVSCKKSSSTPAGTTISFVADIKGSSEIPANSSTATGIARLTFNSVSKILSGTVTFNGLTPIAAHIHKGAVGVAGDVVFPIGSGTYVSLVGFTSVALTVAQEADLSANLYYVNIHTANFPAGEIRGQLIKQVSNSTGTGY